MTISARIIADSYNFDNGIRLVTLQLRFPRFLLPQFNTHRVFSRNASSSRAIPVGKMIEDAENDPVYPYYWGKNKPGMQADEEIEISEQTDCESVWAEARNNAIRTAKTLSDLGAHKQIVNRVLEPFIHSNVIVTATEWDNFFNLRRHLDSQPEIKKLADEMWDQINNPKNEENWLSPGKWHLPYIGEEEKETYAIELLRKMSAARCARVSYNNHDGSKPTMEKDLKLFNRLAQSNPKHLSPTEHQAAGTVTPAFSGNFRGWVQFRKYLE